MTLEKSSGLTASVFSFAAYTPLVLCVVLVTVRTSGDPIERVSLSQLEQKICRNILHSASTAIEGLPGMKTNHYLRIKEAERIVHV